MWVLPEHGSEFDPATLQVTPSERDEIAKLAQGSDAWLKARYGRLTASNFGAAAGNHLPGAKKKLLKAMLWPETHKLSGFAAKFAAYGTEHEAVARDVYTLDRQKNGAIGLRVWETGLLVSLEHGWLGSSPDFVVEEASEAHERPIGNITNEHHCRAPYTILHASGARKFIADANLEAGVTEGPGAAMETTIGCGEIKCPVEKGFGAAMETTIGCGEIKCPAEKGSGATMKTTIGCGEIKCPATKMLYSQTEKHNKYAFPEYYYDQIQGVMAINDWPWCDTVVHTPYVTEVVRFYANPVYWKTDLFPKLERFYFNDFLPRLRLRTQGTLKRGEVDPVLVIPSCVLGLGLDMTLVTKSTAGSKKRKTLEA